MNAGRRIALLALAAVVLVRGAVLARSAGGDTVRLRLRSDVAEEDHIHGYDEYVDVPAGGTATARFEADAEGIFEIESHGSGELLAKLEVRP